MPRWQICCAVPVSRWCLTVNKVDHFEKFMADVYEFYNLGIGDPIPDLGSESSMGIGDLLDRGDHIILMRISTEEEEDDRIRRWL